jgi:aspartyl-tRNA(Asn)/glutamyl-tRNA(Gln) amidotransferase subunit A
MTALAMGRLIRERKLGCTEAAAAILEVISSTDGELNAYISVQKNSAMAAARKVQARLDAGEDLSPLAGVPVSIKDNICTRNVPTTCGSKMLENFEPPYDATVVENLEMAGAVPVGKLNMDEFAMGGSTETSCFGATRNPWDTKRVPGGSSGGAAAAVAAGEAVYAIASDTGGSIRQPCSFCGVSGIKPTYGSVSRYGLVAYASSLDQIGPIGKDIRDCAAALQILSGRDGRDSTSIMEQPFDFSGSFTGDVRDMVIGLPVNYLSDGIDPDVRQAVGQAVKTFEDMGARVEEFTMPMMEYAVPAYYVIACAEAGSNLSRYDGIKYGYRSQNADSLTDVYLKSRSEGFGIEVKRRVMLGSFVLSAGYYDAYYHKALQVRGLIQNAFGQAFQKYDIILSPVAPTTAYKLGEHITDPLKMYLDDVYTVSVNLAGLPAAAIPCGFDRNKLPVGIQLIGKEFSEPELVRAADAFQQNTDWHKRRCGK